MNSFLQTLLPLSLVIGFSGNAHAADASDTFVMGALGDSISRGLDADGLGDRWIYSWATGTSVVGSHLSRLEEKLQRPIRYINEAQSGALSSDIVTQARALTSERLDYVTMQMGADDICHWDDTYASHLDEFEQNIDAAVNLVIAKNADVKILMLPVPDMVHLYDLGAAHECQWKWDIGGVCKPLLGSTVTDDERSAFAVRINAVNDRLRGIASAHAANVRFVPELATHSFTWDEVSPFDCFHPSIAGQSVIAEESWRAGWFGNP